jgi:hypothetical protein
MKILYFITLLLLAATSVSIGYLPTAAFSKCQTIDVNAVVQNLTPHPAKEVVQFGLYDSKGKLVYYAHADPLGTYWVYGIVQPCGKFEGKEVCQ